MWVWLRLLVVSLWCSLNAMAFLISMVPEPETFAKLGAQIQLAATVSQVFLGIALLAVAPGIFEHTREIGRQFNFSLTVMLVAATPLLLAFMILFLFLRILLSDLSAYVRFGSFFAMTIAPSLLAQVVYQSLCYLRLACSQETADSPLFGPVHSIINTLETFNINRVIEGIARIVEGIARIIEPILVIFQKIVQIIVIPILAFTGEPDPIPYYEYTERQPLRGNQPRQTHSNIALERVLVPRDDTIVQSSSCIPSVSKSTPSTSNGCAERSKISTNLTASMPTTSGRGKGKRTSKKSKKNSGQLSQEKEEPESLEQDIDESQHISSNATVLDEGLTLEHGHPKYDPPPYYG